jgi:hypothetical protein
MIRLDLGQDCNRNVLCHNAARLPAPTADTKEK